MNEIRTIKSAMARVERSDDGLLHIVMPEGFELPVGDVTIRQNGNVLTVDAASGQSQEKPKTFEEMLARMVPLTKEEWPDIDDSDLPPLKDIVL